MTVLPKQFDLPAIKPNFNIVIIGHDNCCGEVALKRNILYVLREKKYLNTNDLSIKYESKRFKFITHDNIIWTKYGNQIMKYDHALFFVHSNYNSAEIIINQYYNSLKIPTNLNQKYKPLNNPLPYDVLKQYSAYNTFFVMQNGPIELYTPEYKNTYLDFYNEKPFCYNNVMKLTTNILNRYSMFHNKTSYLCGQMQTRLKELDVMCCYICCMKNNENDIWLPNELNLEIMKLFFLL